MAGLSQDDGGGAVLDDAALVHDEDAVGVLGGQREVVGDEQQGSAAVVQGGEHVVGEVGVQGAGGFVGEGDERGELGAGHDGGPLQHAAGPLVGVLGDPRRRGGDAHVGELAGQLRRVGTLALDEERLADVVPDGAQRVVGAVGILGDVAELAGGEQVPLPRGELQ